VPQVLVFNKIDLLEAGRQPREEIDRFEIEGVQVPRVFVSAHSGTGLPALRRLLSEEVSRRSAPPADGQENAQVHDTPA
jgi:GTPase